MFSSHSLLALMHYAHGWFVSYVSVIGFFAFGTAIERIKPADELQSQACTRLNVAYSACYSLLLYVAKPLTAGCAVWIVNSMGGGLVTLQSSGWGAVASFLLVLLTSDFLEYVFHRVQHTVPVLWRMHEFHHSARAFNVTVTMRHYWLEGLVKGALLSPIIGVLFKVEPYIVVMTAIVFAFNNFYAHLNARISHGRFATWLQSPQYHRLHHSSRPEHYDKNFCQMLPLWDRLFGTLWLPSPHEWPATGLEDDAEPQSLTEAVTWPWRERHTTEVPTAGKTKTV
jgi:sterol desaturase/sphingolipid hydroxylase (fatty acid hydroxylase superfamily)